MNLYEEAFRIARVSLATPSRKRAHFGAVGRRRDGTVVRSTNHAAPLPCPPAHAEARLARKLDLGAVIVVARVKKSGEPGLAMPCPNCQALLRNKGVRTVHYSLESGEFARLVI